MPRPRLRVPRPRPIGLVIAAATAVAMSLLSAGVASAHAGLVVADPADGGTVSTAPTRVVLTFDEAVRSPAVVQVTAPDGRRVDVGGARVADADVDTRVSVVRPGAYTVSYRVTSDDGHPVTGRIVFTFRPAGAPAAAPPPPSGTPGHTGHESGGAGANGVWPLGGLVGFAFLVGVGAARASRRWIGPRSSRDAGSGARPAASTDGVGGRAGLLRWSIGAVVAAGIVLVVVLLVGGGAPHPVPSGLPDPGPLTGWGLPAVRLGADLAGIATLGLLLGAAVLLPSPADRLADVPARGVRLAARAAVLWLATVLVETVLTGSDILGSPPGQVLDPAVLRGFLGGTPEGHALLVQAGLVVLVAGLARSAVSPKGAAAAGALAVVALTPPVLTGHAAAAAGSRELAVASLLVHVLAAAVWVGGLAALAWAAVAGTDGLRLAVPRFSVLATCCFAAVAVSGTVNAGVRLGGLSPLLASAYGGLVLAKVAALAVLGGFGWWHRRRTVGQLAAAGATRAGRRDAARAFLSVAAPELVVMAATVALAVGLSRTPTPVGTVPAASRAAELLGFPLPGAPTVGRVLLGWVPDGFALVFLVLAATLYAAGVLRLRRRGDRWPPGRTVCWYAGLALVAWTSVGGLGRYSHVLFSANMAAHVVLSMVAPLGLVLAAPITLALRGLPGPRVPGELGLRQLLLAVLHSAPVRVLTHPLVALGLFAGSLYAVYLTGLLPVVMRNHLGHATMELYLLAVGSLFFWVVVGVDPTPRRVPPVARVGVMLAAMPLHALFSIAVMSTGTLLAGDYYRALDRPYARDLLADQHLGGQIGWTLGELPMLLMLAALSVRWFRADRHGAGRFDRADDDQLAQYDAYRAALARHDDRRLDEGTPR